MYRCLAVEYTILHDMPLKYQNYGWQKSVPIVRQGGDGRVPENKKLLVENNCEPQFREHF
jgi:hypothetical protein